jgi:alkylation response protein AidB-like acyl-CoA dehydrogenase
MDLSFGPEYEDFRRDVASFLAERWIIPMKAGERPDVAVFRQEATEHGYLYRRFPKIYGGSEQPPDILKARIIKEEFTRVGAPEEISGPGINMLAPTLVELGREDQKKFFIPATLSGEFRWCQGYSEPSSGSDLASVRTSGVLDGDHWVINGQKIWTTQAHLANYMFALVRTEPGAPKHKGLSYLLIDMKQPGVTVRPLRQISGSSEFNEVFFDDVRTPADWIVGARGQGWTVSRTTLKHERDSIGGAQANETLLRKLIETARQTSVDGRPNIERAEIRQALATLEGYVLSQKYSAYRALSMNVASKDPGLIGLLNKLVGTEIGHMVSKIAYDLMGEEGLVMPAPPRRAGGQGGERGHSKWVYQTMGSLGVSIAGGTSNIQRNIIAERGLDLPRESL